MLPTFINYYKNEYMINYLKIYNIDIESCNYTQDEYGSYIITGINKITKEEEHFIMA